MSLSVWSSAGWQAEAVGWADQRLAERGLLRTGEVAQPHLRSWSTVLRIPTSDGTVWLKAPGPGTAFEVDLYPLLVGAAPDAVLHPLAIDHDRRWLLLPDGGVPLGEVAKGPALVEALVPAVRAYARLQRRLAQHVDDLLAIGLLDLRPHAVPQRFTECVADAADYVARRGDGEEMATLERVRQLDLTVRQWAEELSESAVPASLDHNDLHPWNLLCPADNGHARVYDWGDAVVGHPFASLMVALAWLTDPEGGAFDPDGPEVRRVRDAYLGEFTDLAPRADLLRSVELTAHAAKIGRALSWIRVLQGAGEARTGELAGAPLRWLSRLLPAT